MIEKGSMRKTKRMGRGEKERKRWRGTLVIMIENSLMPLCEGGLALSFFPMILTHTHNVYNNTNVHACM
jgi:hypothetical protein